MVQLLKTLAGFPPACQSEPSPSRRSEAIAGIDALNPHAVNQVEALAVTFGLAEPDPGMNRNACKASEVRQPASRIALLDSCEPAARHVEDGQHHPPGSINARQA